MIYLLPNDSVEGHALLLNQDTNSASGRRKRPNNSFRTTSFLIDRVEAQLKQQKPTIRNKAPSRSRHRGSATRNFDRPLQGDKPRRAKASSPKGVTAHQNLATTEGAQKPIGPKLDYRSETTIEASFPVGARRRISRNDERIPGTVRTKSRIKKEATVPDWNSPKSSGEETLYRTAVEIGRGG